MVAKTLSIKKDRTLTQDKVMAILADVTEIPTQRPLRKQQEKYSGKKKRHTLKSEIGMTEDGRIRHISKVHGGRTHDFTIRKNEKPFCRDSAKVVTQDFKGFKSERKMCGFLLRE